MSCGPFNNRGDDSISHHLRAHTRVPQLVYNSRDPLIVRASVAHLGASEELSGTPLLTSSRLNQNEKEAMTKLFHFDSVRTVLIGLAFIASLLIGEPFASGQQPPADPIRIVGAATLTGDPIPAERVPVGVDDDYKPSLGLMPDGELLLIAFHQHKKPDNKVLEQNL